MIIQCENCSRKFVAKDSDIPQEGRTVQCGHCSVTWHQMPVSIPTKILKQPDINKSTEEIDEGLSVDKIKASDGKTYKFLGSQWVQLLPSGKTGLFAKRKIGKELDKLTGRKEKSTVKRKQKKIREAEIEISKLGTAFHKNIEYLYLRSKIFYINKLYYIALDTLLIATEFGESDKIYNLLAKIYNFLGNKELSKKIVNSNLRSEAVNALKKELTGISQIEEKI